MAAANEMYQRAIRTLAQDAVGAGRLDAPSGGAFLDNPLCGDCVDMQVRTHEARVVAIAHKVRGCLLCQAAASLIGKHAYGCTLQDVEHIGAAVGRFLRDRTPVPAGWEELALFTPVRDHASRHGCVELPFRALLGALRDAQANARL